MNPRRRNQGEYSTPTLPESVPDSPEGMPLSAVDEAVRKSFKNQLEVPQSREGLWHRYPRVTRWIGGAAAGLTLLAGGFMGAKALDRDSEPTTPPHEPVAEAPRDPDAGEEIPNDEHENPGTSIEQIAETMVFHIDTDGSGAREYVGVRALEEGIRVMESDNPTIEAAAETIFETRAEAWVRSSHDPELLNWQENIPPELQVESSIDPVRRGLVNQAFDSALTGHPRNDPLIAGADPSGWVRRMEANHEVTHNDWLNTQTPLDSFTFPHNILAMHRAETSSLDDPDVRAGTMHILTGWDQGNYQTPGEFVEVRLQVQDNGNGAHWVITGYVQRSLEDWKFLYGDPQG